MAVLGRVLSQVDAHAAVRSRHAERLLGALARSRRLEAPSPVAGAEPGYLRLPAILRSAEESDVTRHDIQRLGIARGYPATLATLPSLVPKLVGPPRVLPGATRLARSLVTLPTHGLLSEADLAAIERWILA
jgi:dTDP-4-amino-4,6-dideoxygalactose transaminase